MTTYTKHRLTNAQLERLSGVVNGRRHKHGVALDALLRKGLIVENGSPVVGLQWSYLPTEAGVEALRDARREGW